MVRERKKPRSVLAVVDERLLLEAAAPHLRHIIIAALDTGMRRGELLNQCWEHVDFNRRVLFVTKSKTAEGEGREIPLTDRVYSLLAAVRRNDGVVFTFHDQPIRYIKTAWQATMRRARIRYCRFHDLRHTFNTRMMEAGVMQEIRKALMGHSSGQDVHATYTHVELPAKREAIRKLELWLADETRRADQVPEPQGIPTTKRRWYRPTTRKETRNRCLKICPSSFSLIVSTITTPSGTTTSRRVKPRNWSKTFDQNFFTHFLSVRRCIMRGRMPRRAVAAARTCDVHASFPRDSGFKGGTSDTEKNTRYTGTDDDRAAKNSKVMGQENSARSRESPDPTAPRGP